MAHKEQIRFCKRVKKMHPEHFRDVTVLDVGSLDINGNNRHLFRRYKYIGVDIVPGRNVDIVGVFHQYTNEVTDWVQLLRPGGLLLITAAGEGRREHGTTENHPGDSPGTNDYYKNITNKMVTDVLPPPIFLSVSRRASLPRLSILRN